MKTTSRLFLLCLFYFALPLASGYGNEGEATTPANPAEQERKEGEAGYRMALTIKDVEYAFRWCPPGTFVMGITENERRSVDADDMKTQRVTLTRGFWMLETQVTQEMWESVMENNPSAFRAALSKNFLQIGLYRELPFSV